MKGCDIIITISEKLEIVLKRLDISKKELADKQAIEAQQAALDKECYETQIAATNKAMKLYKEKYKDIVEFRRKAFENLDNDIMNAADL